MVLTTCLVPSFRLADFGCNDHVTDDLAALEIVAMFVIICYYLSPATGDFFFFFFFTGASLNFRLQMEEPCSGFHGVLAPPTALLWNSPPQ